MATSQIVLAWDYLTIRSVKAEARRKEAESLIITPETKYGLSTTDPDLQLPGNAVSLGKPVPDDESGFLEIPVSGMPVFYDQTTYNFTIDLSNHDAQQAWVFSIMSKWCDDSEWNETSHELHIPINFGNDLGDFELNWRWIDSAGEEHSGRFRAQVFSTKLDVKTHFQYMLDQAKDRDWIDLDLLKQSTWNFGVDSTAESTQQTWLRLFQDEYATLDTGFRELTERHRKRLKAFDRYVAPERIKRFSPKLEEKVAEGLLEGRERKYRVESRVLEADIPENRLMKNLLKHTLNRVRVISERISSIDRISDVFKTELSERAAGFEQTLGQRFWRGIGAFHGMRGESLVLSQDPLYARVRRSWFRLQFGMRLFEKDLSGGIQNVAQLYEIWCLLKLDALITKKFSWQAAEKPEQFSRPEDDDWELTEPRTGSLLWKYSHNDMPGVELELLFQPTAGNSPSKNGFWDDIIAIPIAQRPDLVLRMRRNDLPQQPVYTWIFDAKYRIDIKEAPPDAVNQMHQYRDAILWQNDTISTVRERESIGAFVLYPGTETDVQFDGISQTNIGAIPLRPTPELSDPAGHLETVLGKLVAVSPQLDSVSESEDRYYAAVPGIRNRSRENIVHVSTRPGRMQQRSYWEKVRFYRIPVHSLAKSAVSPSEWHFIIPNITSDKGPKLMFKVKRFHGAFPRTEIVRRYRDRGFEIDDNADTQADLYYLFELHEQASELSSGALPKLRRKVYQLLERESGQAVLMAAEG